MNNETEFSGVFMFTNPTKTERKYLWNNREYVFPAESSVPLIIPTETLENIQEIRKRFAFRMATERLYEGEKVFGRDGKTVVFDYKKAKEMGNGLPPTFDDRILEPMIEECLKPLPIKRADIKQGKKLDDERQYKATKAMGEKEDPNFIFREESANAPVIGVMSDR